MEPESCIALESRSLVATFMTEEVTNYSSENNLPTFRLNAPVVIRAKVKEVRTNITVYSHTLLTGDKTEGTPGCLREGDDGEVSYSGACVGESPSDRLGGDHSAGPWQRTGAVAEGGPAHPDDTLR